MNTEIPMNRTLRNSLKSAAFASLAFFAMAGVAARADHEPASAKTLVLKDKNGVAIQGYDPVAYFTDSKPVQGNPKFTVTRHGATYHFANQEHKTLFESNPAKYEPAFGGYCGYAASINRLSPVRPEWWQLVEGRLVLQHNKKAFDLYNADVAGNTRKADSFWPGLVTRNGVAGGRSLVLTDKKGVALEGYDPVSYFEPGGPMKGDAAIEGTFNGALYRFTSQTHRETFERDPVRYAPAYGGFCGYAASIGKVRPANPLLWSIVDGQLVVQHTEGAVELWNKDVMGNKTKADQFWPRLVEAKAGQKNPVDSLLGKSVLADAR